MRNIKNLSNDNLFEKFSLIIKGYSGFDIVKYRKSFIKRRILGRMISLGFDDFKDYVEYLAENKDEIKIILDRIGISVSRFFRDYEVFSFLAQVIKEDVRREWVIWSAGCGAGEEVYSIAIILSSLGKTFYIFGSDINEKSLKNALNLEYSDSSFEFIPEIYKKYFFKKENKWFVKKDLFKGGNFFL